MIVKKVEEGLLNYWFPLKEGFEYGFNIYAIINNKSVMLIDSAFRSQARMVLKDLNDRGLKLSHVIATHFHNDHISGLMALDKKIFVLGSPEYEETLTKKLPQKVLPVSFSSEFIFGNFILSFIQAPGHSPCSIAMDINGRYLHVGDNLMSRYDGKAILPWVRSDFVFEHINALKMIKELDKPVILQSHGPKLIGSDDINEAINNRLSYLETVFQTKGNCTYEEATKNCTCEFVGKKSFELLNRDFKVQ